jgi:hypothetical protein
MICDMKKIVLSLLAALVCVSCFAEASSRKEERKAVRDSLKAVKVEGAHHKGVHICIDGEKLSAGQQSLLLSDIEGVDYNDVWAGYRKQRRLGNGLAIGGSAMIGVGAVAGGVSLAYVLAGVLGAALTLGKGDVNPIMDTAGYWAIGGLVSAGAGAGLLAAGIPIRVKADKKMKSVCDSYNNASRRVEKSVLLGPTASGVGISVNF